MLEELRKDMVRSRERWYHGHNQRAERPLERAPYHPEDPRFGKKRLGRAIGLVPPPPPPGRARGRNPGKPTHSRGFLRRKDS